MSRFQTTLGGICRVKNGGLALHFGVESAVSINMILVIAIHKNNIMHRQRSDKLSLWSGKLRASGRSTKAEVKSRSKKQK